MNNGLRLNDNLMLAKKLLMTMCQGNWAWRKEIGRGQLFTIGIHCGYLLNVRAWECGGHLGPCRGGRSCLDEQTVPVEKADFGGCRPNAVTIAVGSSAFKQLQL